MDEDIEKFLNDILDMTRKTEYSFREICGFTFVFKTEHMLFKGNITSAQIEPAGIIYEENRDYYLAPLTEDISKEEIIKEYCKEILLTD